MKLAILLLALAALSACTTNTTNRIWPKPVFFSNEPQGETLKVSPCELKFSV